MTATVGRAPVEALIARLDGELDRVLRRHIPVERPVALIDFPSHTNVGDSAIWCGEVAWLRRTGVPISYVCTDRDYSSQRLSERLDGGTILLSGGGNLGDLWPRHQLFRERVLRDFPGHKIVQLPQSIHFDRESTVTRAAASFGAHPDFTVLARDRETFEFARDRLQVAADLCPDSAFGLGPLARRHAPASGVLHLRRADREAVGEVETASPAVVLADWRLDWPRGEAAARRAASAGLRRTRDRRLAFAVACRPAWACYDALARRQVARGSALLSSARVVVTDRLHGHILCLLLGIPHVLLDNTYGKVRRYHETWTAGATDVYRAEDADEAYAIAEQVLQRATETAGT